MVAVFSRVSVDISAEFIENFPVQFDFKGMLKRICDDVGVMISILGETYNLEGQWNTVGKAHNMLVSTLAVYGSSNSVRKEQEGVLSHGSRPFSALVEAAEAISRGVELQEQVNKEMMDMERMSEHEFEDFHSGSVPQTHISDVNSVIKKQLAFDKTQHGNVKGDTNLELQATDTDDYEHIFYEDETDIQGFSDQEYLARTAENTIKTNHSISFTNSLQGQPSATYSTRNSQNGFKHPKNNDDMNEKSTIVNSYKGDKVQTSGSSLLAGNSNYQNMPSKKNKADSPPKKSKVFPCADCDFVGKTRNAIADHKRRIHRAEPTKCDICKKVFPNARYMKRHRLSHSDVRHECDICGKHYKVLQVLKEHKKRHEKSYIKPEFKCDQCPKSFCSNYVLDSHVKSEHMGIKRSFLCQTCGKSFTTKHTLQQHVNVHMGIRPYKCKECEKSFTYESALRDHLSIHEESKNFRCGFENCTKAFSRRSALKMHERIHKEVKDFKCPECDRGFTQKQALQRHMRAHQNLKPYSCKFCLRKFGEASVIRRHLILVHKVSKEPPHWREDIITHPMANDTETVCEEVDEQTGETSNLDIQVPALTHESMNTFTAGDSNIHSSNVSTVLPPVAAIHNFRPIESYTHDLENPDTEVTVTEQSAHMTSQMSYTVPPQQDYTHTYTVSSSQYNYTVTPVEYNIDTPMKQRAQTEDETHKLETVKSHPYLPALTRMGQVLPQDNPHSENSKLAELPQDNPQSEKSVTVQYLQQTVDDNYTVIDVGKLRKSLEVLTKPNMTEPLSGNTSGATHEQTGLPEDLVVTKEGIDGRGNETVESLENVNMSQFYTYYSNLANQYVNIGQYNILPTAETTDHLA